MDSAAYKLGFVVKLAELNKAALSVEARNALNAYSDEQDKRLGYRPRIHRKTPRGFKDTLKYTGQRAMDYIGSLGRGAASAAGVAGLRATEGGVNMATWFPELADSLIFGKMMGIDEGRGLIGRKLGKFHRSIDSKVHALRKWSDMYDYEHDVGSGFNRMLNGAVADTAGKFIGWGGLPGILKKNIPGMIGGAFGVADALAGSDKELRNRENMIRKMHPRDWAWVDATSTATNQEKAPTLQEYRRYHTPYIPNLPTSTTGYVNVPRRWWFDASGAPIQTRNFGT